MKIITGASRGIGRYLLERYLVPGEVVCGTFFTTEPPGYLSDHYWKVDVSDYASVAEWIKIIVPDKKVELINCAAMNYDSFAHKVNPADWEETIRVNLIGTFNVIRALLPGMRENQYGRIINFSSIVADRPLPGTSAYAASKSALLGMARSLVAENASKGITINNLNLGYFNIGMGRDLPKDIGNKIKQLIPMREFGEPSTIYNAVEFLINNSYVNGANLDINGGLQ